MRQAAGGKWDPARPKNALSGAFATVTAVAREFTNYSIPLIRRGDGWRGKLLSRFPRLAQLPPFGYLWLMASNLTLLLAIVFFGYDVANGRMYESIGVRAGWMTVSQLPLVFLMAGKTNIVGFLTGTSYERLNWIHRSVSRCLFATALVHMSYYLRSWARFDYIDRKLEIDIHARRGLGAFCVLAWLVLSSLAPLRSWRYELFVLHHLVGAVGFLVIVWMHVPVEAQMYVWFPVALWAFDRAVRWGFLAYHNLSAFHPKPASPSAKRPSVFACRALLAPMADRTTRVTIQNPPMSWRPGQHVFLACHSLAPLQSHPFTISSLPSDGVLELVIRAHSGTTGRVHDHACCLPPQSAECKTVFLDGPYGRLRPLEQFDSVVLLAGSTGATFCIPLLRDLVRLREMGKPLVTRRIRFVWVVKGRGQARWFSKELGAALESVLGPDAASSDRKLEMEASIYVTCDPELTSEIGGPSPVSSEEARPSLDTQLDDEKTGKDGAQIEEAEQTNCGPSGTCCCRAVVDNEDAIYPSPEGCCCGATAAAATATTTPQSSPELTRAETGASSIHRTLSLPASVNFVSGRPMVRNVVEKELERARGESAVVVCGPLGLVQTTRDAVVALSDERAVHKGTGAQGVRDPPPSRRGEMKC